MDYKNNKNAAAIGLTVLAYFIALYFAGRAFNKRR
jgi:hypothetical protein